MAKTKPQTNGKPAKAAPSVKDAGVKKSAQKPASKAKDLAKTAAAKVLPKEEKKSKKSKKAPEPEPESESDASDSAASSDADSDESDTEPSTVSAPKTNGAKKVAAAESSDDDSEDSDASEAEKPAPAKAAASKAKKVNGTVAKPAVEGDSDDSEESDEEPAEAGADADTSDESDSSADEDEAPAKKAAAPKVNGAAKDDEDDDSEDDSDDSDESEEEAAPSKKRKADTVSTPVAKKSKTEAPATPTEGNGVKNLFVGGLSWNIDEEWLAREFEEYGEVTGSRIITDRETQRSKGYGYVEFADAASAAAALKARHESTLDGRQIRVDFSTPRPKPDDATPRDRAGSRANKFGDAPGNPTETLFCGNLSFDCTSEAVSEAFEEFGSITSVRLPTDRETGAPKGFGYISFGTVEEAKAALEAMNGQSIAGRNCRLDYAQPRDPASGGGGRGGFGDRGGRGGGRGRGGFGDRGGRGGGRGRGGFGDRGGRGGRGGFTTNRGGFGDFKGNKVSFD